MPPAADAGVAGAGVDLMHLDRFRGLGRDLSDPFFRKTFTVRERELASGQEDPILLLAMAFAGKEAAFKCLGVDGNRVRLNEIEVLVDGAGRASVSFLGQLALAAAAKGIVRNHLQVAHDGDFVWALAVAERLILEQEGCV